MSKLLLQTRYSECNYAFWCNGFLQLKNKRCEIVNSEPYLGYKLGLWLSRCTYKVVIISKSKKKTTSFTFECNLILYKNLSGDNRFWLITV